MAYEWKVLLVCGDQTEQELGQRWGRMCLCRTLFYHPRALGLVKLGFLAGLSSCWTIEIAISEITLGNLFLNLSFSSGAPGKTFYNLFPLWLVFGFTENPIDGLRFLSSLESKFLAANYELKCLV